MSNPSESFPVVVTSPDEVIWEGEAESVSSENSAGAFDILPEHANFVTIIQKGSPITVRTVDKKTMNLGYRNAVLAVKEGKVDIYADL